MFASVRPALVLVGLFTLLLGLAYPLAVTGAAQVAFPGQADGSLVRDADGAVVGSALIGQPFEGASYLHPRPSAAGDGYNAAGSSGSNYGPLNPDLATRVAESTQVIRAVDGPGAVPADAVTASGSGLDPHISPDYARLQAGRIARERGVAQDQVLTVIEQHVEHPLFGFIGQPRVNVLLTNRDLDTQFPGG